MPDAAPAKMTITAYSDPNFTSKITSAPNPFTVWINPAEYSQSAQIVYTDRQSQGSPGPSPEYNRVGEQEIAFDLTFDATGVVPAPTSTSYTNGVSDVVNQFIALTSTVNGTIHSPNYLTLNWGTLSFNCVLCSLKIDYTLFRPDGTPLRAKLGVSFKSYTSETALAKETGFESPDMTHLVTVQAGDTLPLLCHRIYGDSGYYAKVAAFNRLPGFRSVKLGTQLLFPPLSGSAP